ncbi:hypothetical protein BpHYR1_011728 [Brachionus plicatilis]|uniref:Uncharacterized protein n=1 Tax=Brachionus plicatilis TaxID=10195 RepID=A0A3M7Q7E1_BRAPC|nr:hypothetical protein BpHYR1_011728 [Brachionus plicatilis]
MLKKRKKIVSYFFVNFHVYQHSFLVVKEAVKEKVQKFPKIGESHVQWAAWRSGGCLLSGRRGRSLGCSGGGGLWTARLGHRAGPDHLIAGQLVQISRAFGGRGAKIPAQLAALGQRYLFHLAQVVRRRQLKQRLCQHCFVHPILIYQLGHTKLAISTPIVNIVRSDHFLNGLDRSRRSIKTVVHARASLSIRQHFELLARIQYGVIGKFKCHIDVLIGHKSVKHFLVRKKIAKKIKNLLLILKKF